VTVGLVIVSHSAALAAGVCELAGQMAPDVTLLPAGGLPDGGLGTDFDTVSNALDRAESGSGVVLLYDLGSAQMTAELAVESLGNPNRAFVVDAPLVEGAVAAAVAAQGGADLDGVAEAAASAGADYQPPDDVPDEPPGAALERDLVLRNEVGLHARPAALLARALTGLDAQVTARLGDQSVDARSVLGLMALSARQGDTVRLTATGPDAAVALDRVEALAARDFEE
jgi:PTS hybrid protein